MIKRTKSILDKKKQNKKIIVVLEYFFFFELQKFWHNKV